MNSDYELELAKSKFELARICLMIAAFLVVASGIFWNMAFGFLGIGVNLAQGIATKQLNFTNSTFPQEIFNSSIEPGVSSSVDLGISLLYVAAFLVLMAIVALFRGDYIIRKLRDKPKIPASREHHS